MPFASSSDRFALIRQFGAAGSILIALGGLGVGAQPVLQDPVRGVRLFGLFERTLAASATMVFVGLAVLVLAWLLLGRVLLAQQTDVGGIGVLRRVAVLWAAPLVLAPPMFSQDVYSYLAHGMGANRGLDPYRYGPADALGHTDVFVRSVPTIWQDTPSPYGPLFLVISKFIAQATGYHVVAAVLVHRLVALAGVAMILWALPRLARRCGVDEAKAFWLGALNPLIFLHLVSGTHNDSLMIGLMLVGVELSLHGAADWPARRALAEVLAGAVVITAAAMVKLPAELALGFVGVQLAAKAAPAGAGLLKRALAVGVVGGAFGLVSLAVTLLLNRAAGHGFEWTHTLNAATKTLNWLSPPTVVARLTGYLGEFVGLGNHTTSVLAVTWALTTLAASCAVGWLLFKTLQGRIHPIGGIGVAFTIVVALLPTIHTWYALWALVPLSAWVVRAEHRKALVVIITVLSFMAYPSGGFSLPFILLFGQTTGIAAAVALGGLVFGWKWLTEPWSACRNRAGRRIETS
ncbi:MAG: polyprenol phosphomannose-dependent alpha 1,6 mannosyltransferase MptB [Segniliparus sp.]|uniref:polyprenol phosphomannose-dependent alpha 1,6 mannosyltransferase MptB n=1 Tax=Segniliparus sp. TaxID=2804064 RepID=UPI003F2B2560